MSNPWDNAPIVKAAAASDSTSTSGNPWDNAPIVKAAAASDPGIIAKSSSENEFDKKQSVAEAKDPALAASNAKWRAAGDRAKDALNPMSFIPGAGGAKAISVLGEEAAAASKGVVKSAIGKAANTVKSELKKIVEHFGGPDAPQSIKGAIPSKTTAIDAIGHIIAHKTGLSIAYPIVKKIAQSAMKEIAQTEEASSPKIAMKDVVPDRQAIKIGKEIIKPDDPRYDKIMKSINR
jgi:hypothetical protein